MEDKIDKYPINMNTTDTICAIATPPGSGAIAVIRMSGPETFSIIEKVFEPKKKGLKISDAKGYTIHFGSIIKPITPPNPNPTATATATATDILDEVLLYIFRQPNSYTGEDAVEISCHGSIYIQQKIIELLINLGCRLAKPGEFTMRAFMNGKFDLSQAEAVADLIAAGSQSAHDLALDQMRGGFSAKIKDLRQRLLDFTSLLELELDFSEEEVEFANRDQFLGLLAEMQDKISKLTESFSVGNVIKKGIPVAIIGKPNVGKSTLLNAILNEERAIVSEIPGTTRDVIEDTIVIDGISFRFIDTAGIRQARDQIESIGIERTFEKVKEANIILYVCDISQCTIDDTKEIIEDFNQLMEDKSKKWILIGNKIDQLVNAPSGFKAFLDLETIFVSAKRNENINLIIESLRRVVDESAFQDSTLVSNTRHYEALKRSLESLADVEDGFSNNIPTDLIAIDIKQALHYLGEITGEITSDEVLGNIFGRFCIGK